MIEEVVNNIIEAEDRAAQIRYEAKEEAKKTLADAKRQSSARRDACVKECRAEKAARKEDAQRKADAAYAEVLEDGKRQRDELGAAYGANVEKAAQAVADAVIG